LQWRVATLAGQNDSSTLYYKLNPFTTFAVEQSQYQTTLLPNIGPAYDIAGHPATQWKDQRTEFGPIFTFWLKRRDILAARTWR